MSREIKLKYVAETLDGRVIKETFPLSDIERGYAKRWIENNKISHVIAKLQFTGLKDINDTDIYEGDLLHELDPCQWKPAPVEFKDGAFEISLTKRTRYPINAKYISENDLVMIGNIHEQGEKQ